MRAFGVSAFEQSGVRHYIEDHKSGAFEFGAPTNRRLGSNGPGTGGFRDHRPPLRGGCRRPAARSSNGLRALGDFMRIGITPAYNLGRYEREQQHPFPVHPQLAAIRVYGARSTR